MGRGPKPAKGKVKPAVPRKSPENEDSKVRDLEKRLAEALRDKAEALERETATSEILRVIASSPTDERPVFETIVASALRLLNGHAAGLRTLHGDELHMSAFTSTTPSGDSALAQGPIAVIPVSSSPHFARVVKDRTPLVVEDTETESGLPPGLRQVARARGYRSGLNVPLLRGETVLGVLNVTRVAPGPFSAADIALLQTFADQAVIAIENVRLFTELQEKNSALTTAHAQVSEALEQQTATAEILQVISSSPTDVQPVFDTIAESAARLCGSIDAVIFRVEDDTLRLVASYGPIETIGRGSTLPIDRGTGAGRAVVTRQTIHIPDMLTLEAEFPEGAALARRQGYRTTLSIPLLREGVAVGAITIRRAEVRPFADTQVKLLQTFADQAVIAIENVRLFNETKEALDRQTATSEILRVISSSPTDTQPVFDAIARNAVALCGGIGAVVLRFDGEMLHVAAHHAMSPEGVERLERAHPRPPGRDSPPGRAFLDRNVVQVPDLQAASEFAASTARQRGAGSQLAVPLLREQEAIGVIGLARDVVGPFSPEQIDVLQTFADQAARTAKFTDN
jgi:two-component system, NtrC family, sensor kinase